MEQVKFLQNSILAGKTDTQLAKPLFKHQKW